MGHVCGAVRACRSGMRNTIGEHLWIPGRKAHAKGQARYVVAHLLLSGKASELSVVYTASVFRLHAMGCMVRRGVEFCLGFRGWT
eukprot:1183997-Prorocentrum_minimum.AAC.2